MPSTICLPPRKRQIQKECSCRRQDTHRPRRRGGAGQIQRERWWPWYLCRWGPLWLQLIRQSLVTNLLFEFVIDVGSDVRNDILSTILGIGSLQANSSFIHSHPQLSSPRVSTSEKINGSVRHHLLIRRDLISSLSCWICRSLTEDAPPLLKIPLLREWFFQGTKIVCGMSRGCWYAYKFSWSNIHDQERFSTFRGLPPLKRMENLPRVQPRFYRNRVISTTGIGTVTLKIIKH